MSDPIIIEKYNPKWSEFFEDERIVIEKALSNLVISIEHIGSTAVPGMDAKPIIDIIIGVETFDDIEKCIPILESIGYIFDPNRVEDFPKRKSLDKQFNGIKIHLYIVDINSHYWEQHLLFRDYLRKHPDVAKEYNNLKQGLVQLFKNDRKAYTNGKSKFIKRIEKKARKEYS